MSGPCYSGPNPIKDDERLAVWNWAKANGIDAGIPIEDVGKAINDHFFGGQGKAEWINDILGGRKTPFRAVANEMWKRQYNRRVITQQAKEISQLGAMGRAGKTLRLLWALPRTVAVAGHGIVFPITHAGDLTFRPASWGTLIKGMGRTYRAAPELWGLGSKLGGGKAYAGRMIARMEGDAMFDTAIRGGLDAGKNSHPSGLISRSYHGPAQRAWDMLTVLRFELWKREMSKYVKPGMDEATVNDIGANLAEWANNATGSGKGRIADLGGNRLFGPKLTQSKVNRLTSDPAKTIKTFKQWDKATAGERAVAMTRLSGATQYLVSKLGFLAVNAGVLAWLKQDEKINFTNPFRGDFLGFKGAGVEGNVPGLHSEIKMVATLLATAFAAKKPPGWVPDKLAQLQQEWKKQLQGDAKFTAVAKTGGRYAMSKLTPTIQRGLEVATGEDYAGRPLPWSSEEGTRNRPQLTTGEYLGDIGPIPTSGAIGYVYDQLKKTGASVPESHAIVKALIIGGMGLPGFHVREDYEKPEKVWRPR